MAQFTERGEFSYQDTVAFSLAPAQLIGLITPGFFGSGPGLHWGLWDRVELPYAGVITLLAALFALFGLGHRESRRDLWPWLGLAAFGMAVALGIYGVIHGWLTQLLPGFDQFRAPARATVLWTLAVAVLGAAGIERMANGKWQGANDRASSPPFSILNSQFSILKSGALALFGFVLLGYFALFMTQSDETLFVQASVALLAVTLAIDLLAGDVGLDPRAAVRVVWGDGLCGGRAGPALLRSVGHGRVHGHRAPNAHLRLRPPGDRGLPQK